MAEDPRLPYESAILMANRMASASTEDDGPRWTSPTGLASSRERIVSMVERYAGDPSDRETTRIVDLGCGDGALTADLAAEFPRAAVVGVDVAPEARLATERRLADLAALPGTPRNAVVGGEATDVLAHLRPADVVVAVNVFHETRDPVVALEAVREALRPDGVLVATFPGEAPDGELPAAMQAVLHRTSVTVDGEEIELPQVRKDLTFDGETVEWRQYQLPWRKVRRMLSASGFEVVDSEEVLVDARGMVHVAETIVEDPEMAAQARELAAKQRTEAVGPTVDCYALEPTDGGGD